MDYGPRAVPSFRRNPSRESKKITEKKKKKKKKIDVSVPSGNSPWSEEHEELFHPKSARTICLRLVLYSCSLNIPLAYITGHGTRRVFYFSETVQIKKSRIWSYSSH